MESLCKKKILETRSIAEATRIVESAGGNKSMVESMRIAIGIEPNQKDLARQLRETVVSDMEDLEKKKKEDVSEVDGGTSTQSSSTTGLPKEGTEVAKGDVRSEPDTKDQMGVPVNETYPGMVPPQQPMQQMGQVPPQVPQQVTPKQVPQPMQQMQYIVQEALKPIRESIQKLDSDLREVKETQRTPQSLEIGSRVSTPMLSTAITETQRLSPLNEDNIKTKYARLENDRNEISRLNSYFESSKKTPGVE